MGGAGPGGWSATRTKLRVIPQPQRPHNWPETTLCAVPTTGRKTSKPEKWTACLYFWWISREIFFRKLR